jgi:putative component of membrane protein insertase Oxa1/YidC/SpoIIIJ protein YidD
MTDPARGCSPSRVSADLFFSENRAHQNIAVGICRNECPFLSACDAYATQQGEREGVWGGKVRSSKQVRNTTPQTDDTVVVDQALTSRPELFKKLTTEQKAEVVRAGLQRGIAMHRMSERLQCSSAHAQASSSVTTSRPSTPRSCSSTTLGRKDPEIALALDASAKSVFNSRMRQHLPSLYGPGGRVRKRKAVTA